MMIDKIKQDKKLLEKQLFWVETSFNECKSIGIKLEYSVEDNTKIEIYNIKFEQINGIGTTDDLNIYLSKNV
jgi:hypothetical protein